MLERQPEWYCAFMHRFEGGEQTYEKPDNAYQLFLGAAWFLDEKPDRLARYADVPGPLWVTGSTFKSWPKSCGRVMR